MLGSEISKLIPSEILPPAGPHSLNLAKQHHQPQTKYPSRWAKGLSHSNCHNTQGMYLSVCPVLGLIPRHLPAFHRQVLMFGWFVCFVSEALSYPSNHHQFHSTSSPLSPHCPCYSRSDSPWIPDLYSKQNRLCHLIPFLLILWWFNTMYFDNTHLLPIFPLPQSSSFLPTHTTLCCLPIKFSLCWPATPRCGTHPEVWSVWQDYIVKQNWFFHKQPTDNGLVDTSLSCSWVLSD